MTHGLISSWYSDDSIIIYIHLHMYIHITRIQIHVYTYKYLVDSLTHWYVVFRRLSSLVSLNTNVQPIADRLAQNIENISENFQFSTRHQDSNGIMSTILLLPGTNRKSQRQNSGTLTKI